MAALSLDKCANPSKLAQSSTFVYGICKNYFQIQEIAPLRMKFLKRLYSCRQTGYNIENESLGIKFLPDFKFKFYGRVRKIEIQKKGATKS